MTTRFDARMSKDMSVYFFHVRNGDLIYLDHEGVDLPDLLSAWDLALADARLIFRTRKNEAAAERWIEVHDRRGHLVSTPPRDTTFN